MQNIFSAVVLSKDTNSKQLFKIYISGSSEFQPVGNWPVGYLTQGVKDLSLGLLALDVSDNGLENYMLKLRYM